jgi:chitinase
MGCKAPGRFASLLGAFALLGCAAESKTAPGGTGSPAARDGGAILEGGAAAIVLDAGGAGAPEAEPARDGGTELSPYFPAWTFGGKGYAYTSLANLAEVSGIDDVTLAFVLARPDGGCASDLSADGIGDNMADVRAFIAAGGHAKLSFGGAQGLYLQDPAACTNAADLAAAIGSVVDATGITDLDFDVEQPFNSGMSEQANTNLGQALHSLQQTRAIQLGLTVQVNTDPSAAPGLEGQAQLLVGAVAGAGAQIGRVNLMVMSFGNGRPSGATEAQAAITALNGAQAELETLVPGLTDAQAWKILGATAEIGQNDQNAGEIFTVADATTLASFALGHGMGLVSFWSIDRDRVCAGQCGFQKYSTVNASDFEFAKAFLAVLH